MWAVLLGRAMATLLALCLLALSVLLPPGQVRAASGPLSWQRMGRDLERESGSVVPVQVSKFSRFNERPKFASAQYAQQVDLFQCVEPSRELFEKFLHQYNRTIRNNSPSDKLERLGLFGTTLKRTIVLNRIIQNEILNETNYELKPEIRNYHFVSPVNNKNVALWYADITDCELGLIKYIMFDLFYLIDKNDLATAYKLAKDSSDHLPLLQEDGFEQLANILLVRLYDRFQGDQKMDQLFRWPLYLKRLASYAYSRRQASESDFGSKLALIAYAYPAYFKDLKYNAPAANRSGDNVRAHQEHEHFNRQLKRKFANLQERNKRLAIFRQRWTLINLLNEHGKAPNVSDLAPDWLRAQQQERANSENSDDLQGSSLTAAGGAGFSEKLRLVGDGNEEANENNLNHFKHTQFSDLTDAEFVAYLTNDFTLLNNNQESANFLDANFPIRPLDDSLRWELARELELRRLARPPAASTATAGQRSELALARRVVDELIGDVGLPVGATFLEGIAEQEHYEAFNQVANFFAKPYASSARNGARSAELDDEQVRRYEQFKLNYGHFKAWLVKEGWQLDGPRLVVMLRLADMSWNEIKLTLFKLCCLTEENLYVLAAQNTTIQYLATHQQLCQPMTAEAANADSTRGQSNANTNESNEQRQQRQLATEVSALELYYYYSVHFNKHHSSRDIFNERFATFRRNIDKIRRHSCTRSLTLYGALKLKRAEMLSTIDTLDPRRSITDDLNLDRYDYFSAPAGSHHSQLNDGHPVTDSDLGFERAAYATPTEERRRTNERVAPSRAGISYRREPFFANLLDEVQQQRQQQQQSSPGQQSYYVDKLTSQAQDVNLYAQRYRRNGASKVYDLVSQRYNICVRTLRNVDVPASGDGQKCQADGPLRDQTLWANNGQLISPELSLQLQKQDQCAFYWLGLEPWAEGLIKQDDISPKLIHDAKCFQ